MKNTQSPKIVSEKYKSLKKSQSPKIVSEKYKSLKIVKVLAPKITRSETNKNNIIIAPKTIEKHVILKKV